MCDPCRNSVTPSPGPTSTSGTNTTKVCAGRCGAACLGNSGGLLRLQVCSGAYIVFVSTLARLGLPWAVLDPPTASLLPGAGIATPPIAVKIPADASLMSVFLGPVGGRPSRKIRRTKANHFVLVHRDWRLYGGMLIVTFIPGRKSSRAPSHSTIVGSSRASPTPLPPLYRGPPSRGPPSYLPYPLPSPAQPAPGSKVGGDLAGPPPSLPPLARPRAEAEALLFSTLRGAPAARVHSLLPASCSAPVLALDIRRAAASSYERFTTFNSSRDRQSPMTHTPSDWMTSAPRPESITTLSWGGAAPVWRYHPVDRE
mmetsp:Transcript_25509/g.63866  ORF Transcript_25509/g.63866 Transcript_25509/m.63866 type:complete len:313 (-) Transcript_25509:532-1470(-)